MAIYSTIHTTYGLQRMLQAQANGTPINLAAMAVGDGKGRPVTPDEEQTQLVREIAASRRAPNRVYQDPQNSMMFIAELIVPAELSGFTMREVGIFDETGALFAVGNIPAIEKTDLADGSFANAVVKIQFMVTNADVVKIVMDPNVVTASQEWITNYVTPATLLPGGTTGQVPRKLSNADGDIEWTDPASVNVLVNTIEEEQTLAAGQVNVDLTLTTTTGLAVYVDGERLPNRAGVDGWQPHASIATRAVLGQSYPDGTKIICAQNEPNSQLVDPLAKSLNLSDVPDKAAARANLNVYSTAEVDARGRSPGDIFFTSADTAPPGSLKANGAAVSRTAFARLFSRIGTKYGPGDGFNTFNLPDMRGEFVRGLDDGRGVDPGRTLGSAQAHMLALHTHAATADSQGGHTHSGATSTVPDHQHDSGWGENSNTASPFGAYRSGVTGSGGTDTDNLSWATGPAGAHSHSLQIDAAGTHAHNIAVAATGGAETRPRNIAFLGCIQY